MRAYPDSVWELKQQRLDEADSGQVAVDSVWLLIAHGPSTIQADINWISDAFEGGS